MRTSLYHKVGHPAVKLQHRCPAAVVTTSGNWATNLAVTAVVEMCNGKMAWLGRAEALVLEQRSWSNHKRFGYLRWLLRRRFCWRRAASYFRWCNGAVAADSRPQGRLFI